MTDKEYNIGDDVVIIRATYRKHDRYGLPGKSGKITSMARDDGGIARVAVKIPGIVNPGSGTGVFWFEPDDIKIIDKGANKMSKLIDKDAKVCQLVHCATGECSYGIYYDKIKPGDYVIADYHYYNGNLSVRIVNEIDLDVSVDAANCEVLGVADVCTHVKRKEVAERRAELKKLMGERMRKFQEEQYWLIVSELDPEMASLYEEFKKLGG